MPTTDFIEATPLSLPTLPLCLPRALPIGVPTAYSVDAPTNCSRSIMQLYMLHSLTTLYRAMLYYALLVCKCPVPALLSSLPQAAAHAPVTSRTKVNMMVSVSASATSGSLPVK